MGSGAGGGGDLDHSIATTAFQGDPVHAAVSSAVDAVFAGVLEEVESGMNLKISPSSPQSSPRSARDYVDK